VSLGVPPEKIMENREDFTPDTVLTNVLYKGEIIIWDRHMKQWEFGGGLSDIILSLQVFCLLFWAE